MLESSTQTYMVTGHFLTGVLQITYCLIGKSVSQTRMVTRKRNARKFSKTSLKLIYVVGSCTLFVKFRAENVEVLIESKFGCIVIFKEFKVLALFIVTNLCK